ncbi:mechanosensitive ion channel family protein [Nocardioides mangrovicus]|uniref:Mechanosensitive ion channel family protein n=1 Tax=Nocardioides mangrovicus TaxID=2478913 RepID=A0A3L8P0L7_9ACTN|nr:mechanosensitive ion channel domain-containing protein [Nocardioides mangrovicus]RLV48995.1 mechanosensitive ion channel family protein [Nocardioides mangrovicus]
MAVSWTVLLTSLASGLGAAVLVMIVVHVVARLATRRWRHGRQLVERAERPFRALVLVLAVAGVVAAVRDDDRWWTAGTLALRVLAIGAGAWLVGVLLLFVVDQGLQRTDIDVPDNLTKRRRRTQVLVIRRLTVAAVVVVGLAAMLLSFPGVRGVGASLLASAGLISVVAAVAAQSTLANVFAGLQIAFSDAVRIDDAVIVEEEWGWVEEVTLSYVVVRLWDDRRMVLPCTYFTTTPFQNWTRHTSQLLGSVELDLDWQVDTDLLREEVARIMPEAQAAGLWDGRVSHVQVTDAVNGWVRVRVLVTARDAPTLFDLRCLVRERLIGWLRTSHPEGLPQQRLRLAGQLEGSPTR